MDELVKALREYGDTWRDQLLYEAAEAIEQLEAALPKWIPVTERLPEKNTWVLAYGKYNDHVVDYVDINGLWSYGNITHWMPLPEPPEEKH